MVDACLAPDPVLVEQQKLVGRLHSEGHFPIGQAASRLLRMVVLSEDLQESGCLKIRDPSPVGLELAKQGHLLIDELFSLGRQLCPNHKVSGECPVGRLDYNFIT